MSEGEMDDGNAEVERLTHAPRRLHDELRDDYHAIRIVYRATATDETAPLRHEHDGSTDLACWFGPAELDDLPLVDLVRTSLTFRDR